MVSEPVREPGPFAMFQKLPEPIRDCLDHAASAERRAAEAADSSLRADYEQLARDWGNIASRYELVDKLEKLIIALEQVKEAAAASADREAHSVPTPIGLPASDARSDRVGDATPLVPDASAERSRVV
jgi:hypothetical protein